MRGNAIRMLHLDLTCRSRPARLPLVLADDRPGGGGGGSGPSAPSSTPTASAVTYADLDRRPTRWPPGWRRRGVASTGRPGGAAAAVGLGLRRRLRGRWPSWARSRPGSTRGWRRPSGRRSSTWPTRCSCCPSPARWPSSRPTGRRRRPRRRRAGAAADPERPVAIVFTSGTTGQPKGACSASASSTAVAEIDTGGAWAPARAAPGRPMLASTQFAHVGFMTKLPWYLRLATRPTSSAGGGPTTPCAPIAAERMPSIGGVAPQIALLLRVARARPARLVARADDRRGRRRRRRRRWSTAAPAPVRRRRTRSATRRPSRAAAAPARRSTPTTRRRCTPWAGPGRASRWRVRRRGRAAAPAAGRGGRAVAALPDADAGLLAGPGGDGRRARSTAGCAPATWPRSTSRLPVAWPGGAPRCTSGAATTCYPAEVEAVLARPPGGGRGGGRAPARPGDGRDRGGRRRAPTRRRRRRSPTCGPTWAPPGRLQAARGRPGRRRAAAHADAQGRPAAAGGGRGLVGRARAVTIPVVRWRSVAISLTMREPNGSAVRLYA